MALSVIFLKGDNSISLTTIFLAAFVVKSIESGFEILPTSNVKVVKLLTGSKVILVAVEPVVKSFFCVVDSKAAGKKLIIFVNETETLLDKEPY